MPDIHSPPLRQLKTGPGNRYTKIDGDRFPIHYTPSGNHRREPPEIHDGAASVLYGEKRFSFVHRSRVGCLKEWLDQVGSDNLHRIRKATISCMPGDEPALRGTDLFEANRTFTLCLRKIATACTELQDRNIFECAGVNDLMMPASDQHSCLDKSDRTEAAVPLWVLQLACGCTVR